MKQAVITNLAPGAVGPYSQAIDAGGMLFISGQLPLDPATGAMPEEISLQTRQALTNLSTILSAAGSTMDNVVQVRVFLTDLNTFAAVNAVYADFFSSPHPARCCVEVSKLPKGASVEIEAVALK